MNELELLKQAAIDFLNVADELHENISNYMNGSNDPTDVNAYNRVKEKNAYFIKLHNEYYGENRVPSLDYELAESLLPELFEDFTD